VAEDFLTLSTALLLSNLFFSESKVSLFLFQ